MCGSEPMTTICPICEYPIVQPSGNANSKILVISEEPSIEDLKFGQPFKGEYGMILRTELGKYALDLFQMRMTCLWLHRIVKKNKAESAWHYEQVMRECMNKKAILLLGTDVTQVFLKHSATEISGLILRSDLLSADIVVGTRSPMDVLVGSHGEFTLAIEKFAKVIKKGGYYQ